MDASGWPLPDRLSAFCCTEAPPLCGTADCVFPHDAGAACGLRERVRTDLGRELPGYSNRNVGHCKPFANLHSDSPLAKCGSRTSSRLLPLQNHRAGYSGAKWSAPALPRGFALEFASHRSLLSNPSRNFRFFPPSVESYRLSTTLAGRLISNSKERWRDEHLQGHYSDHRPHAVGAAQQSHSGA